MHGWAGTLGKGKTDVGVKGKKGGLGLMRAGVSFVKIR